MTTLSEKDVKLFKKWLKSHLAYGPTTVVFTKKDGTERVMECTTNPSLVPQEPASLEEAIQEHLNSLPHQTNTDNPVDFPKVKKARKVNPDIMNVYDLENQAWKSFRWDSIKSVRFTL
jgi:hypothetical protein